MHAHFLCILIGKLKLVLSLPQNRKIFEIFFRLKCKLVLMLIHDIPLVFHAKTTFVFDNDYEIIVFITPVIRRHISTSVQCLQTCLMLTQNKIYLFLKICIIKNFLRKCWNFKFYHGNFGSF